MADPKLDNSSALAGATLRARQQYARLLGGAPDVPWWSVVIITASSARQAQRYEAEIRQRQSEGQLPRGVTFLVVPDLDDERLGSGGATLNALRVLATESRGAGSLPQWWAGRRVLMLHSGGDSRRLPQYSLSGKLFSVLPVSTPTGRAATVFDETLALSTGWAAQLTAGLVVGSGDVMLSFDAAALRWERPGVCGVAMRVPMAVAAGHGVYVADPDGRVYGFLQKPTRAQVEAAGGLVAPDTAALDTGLFRFDPEIAARLSRLAGVDDSGNTWAVSEGTLAREHGRRPELDIYEHFAFALTGQWTPQPEEGRAHVALAETLRRVPFWCDLVDGEFTHIGTTRLFRELITEETNFLKLYEAQQRLPAVNPEGVRSAGVIVDSLLAGGGDLGPGAIVLECDLQAPLRVQRGGIAHGLNGLPGPVLVPEDTVLHQVPVMLPAGAATVLRVYGVADDPKQTFASEQATWLNRPFAETLQALGLTPEEVWAETGAEPRSLWNAALFPATDPATAWACAQWFLGLTEDFNAAQWRALPRLSLADCAVQADVSALAAARQARLQQQWVATAVGVASGGGDLRPHLAFAPAPAAIAAAGEALLRRAAHKLKIDEPSAAASAFWQGQQCLQHAGRADEAAAAQQQALQAVREAVDRGGYPQRFALLRRQWQHTTVQVSAPARADLGGGWSDTPPFCLDFGGTVLNLALEIDGALPIRTTLRRLNEPLIRCHSRDCDTVEEFRTAAEVLAPPRPGSPSALGRAALAMTGLVRADDDLPRVLAAAGGGLQLETEVALPMGSGLGTSSILGVTLLQAIATMLGQPLAEQELCEQVLALEQFMTTGGGWQDQAGAIFPGLKLITSAPGARQHLHRTPVALSPDRREDFEACLTLYFTGLRRIAKNLLGQIVGRYLAREAEAVQVLHTIKTLALEMKYALEAGDWLELGRLLDRHWQLNQVLDPNTTNAPVEALLAEARPYLAGAKLAGAGAGGFMLLLSPDREQAAALRARLAALPGPGRLHGWSLCDCGIATQVRD